MGDTLTPKQEAFAIEYIASGFRAQAAAIAVGYAPGSAAVRASEHLANPLVRDYINAHLAERGMTREKVLTEMMCTAFMTDIADYEGLFDGSISLAELKTAGIDTRQISECTKNIKPNGDVTCKIKLRDASKIQDKLATVLGLYQEIPQKLQLSGRVETGRNLTDEETQAIVNCWASKDKGEGP